MRYRDERIELRISIKRDEEWFSGGQSSELPHVSSRYYVGEAA